MIDLAQRGRVLYVCASDLSLGRGPSVNEREFVLALAHRLGDRAHFVLPRPSTPIAELDRLKTVTWTKGHAGHRPLRLVSSYRSQLRAARSVLAEQDFDLIIYRLDVLPWVPYALSKSESTPFVIKTLGFGVMYSLERKFGAIGKVFNKLNHRWVRRIVESASAVDACTEKFVEFFSSRFAIREGGIRCIENATNVHRFEPADRETCRRELGVQDFDPIIGFVGGRPSERGGRQILEVLPRLIERFPKIGAVICGDGPGLEGLKEFANSSGLADRVLIPGAVPYEQVTRYIATFDVGVSLDKTENIEAYGNSSQKVRQYLSCGRPVVSTAGGNDFLTEHKIGSLVDPKDLDGFMRAVELWIAPSADEREALIERARSFAVDHLSIEAALEERLSFWSSIPQSESGPQSESRSVALA